MHLRILFLLVALLLVGALMQVVFTTTRDSATLSLNGAEVAVEIAASRGARSKGLAGREGLQENSGMLFAYKTPGAYGFWMKDMRFPLDIIWIGADGRVVGVTESVSPDTYPEKFYPPEPAQYVLEVNAGWAERNGVEIGTEVEGL